MRREEKKRATREAILDRAAAGFRARGFDETRLRDLHEPLGLSEQTLLNYFPSKQALLDALALRWLAAQTAGVAAADAASRSDRADTITELSRHMRPFVEAIEADRAFMALVFTRSSLFQGGPAHADRDGALYPHTRAAFDALTGAIAAAQSRGELRSDVPAQQLGEIAFAVFRTTTTLWLNDYWGDDESLLTRLERAFTVVWSGARAQEA